MVGAVSTYAIQCFEEEKLNGRTFGRQGTILKGQIVKSNLKLRYSSFVPVLSNDLCGEILSFYLHMLLFVTKLRSSSAL